MKKYILFAGSNYYPSGGWEDFISEADDIAVLVIVANTKLFDSFSNESYKYDWWHIIDTETNNIVMDNLSRKNHDH